MSQRKKSELPPIPWAKNGGELIYKLLAEVEKPQHRLVIIGKKDASENSSGTSRNAVFKAIGKIILPDACAIDEDAVGKRVELKYDDVYSTYKKHAKRLRQTGGGLGGNDNCDEGLHEYMACYIPENGPNPETPMDAQNLWGQIVKDFPFFPIFHRLYSTRANVNPPSIITGVGPDGRKITHLQPPAPERFPDSLIDPALINLTATPPRRSASPIPTSPPVPATPVRSPLKEIKENIDPAASKKVKVKNEGPNLSAAILRARDNVKKIPAKRSLEDTLISIHENTVKQSAQRAAIQDNITQRRLMLDEKDQLIKMQALGIFSKEEFRAKLAEIDQHYEVGTQPKPAKRARLSYNTDSSSDIEIL